MRPRSVSDRLVFLLLLSCFLCFLPHLTLPSAPSPQPWGRALPEWPSFGTLLVIRERLAHGRTPAPRPPCESLIKASRAPCGSVPRQTALPQDVLAARRASSHMGMKSSSRARGRAIVKKKKMDEPPNVLAAAAGGRGHHRRVCAGVLLPSPIGGPSPDRHAPRPHPVVCRPRSGIAPRQGPPLRAPAGVCRARRRVSARPGRGACRPAWPRRRPSVAGASGTTEAVVVMAAARWPGEVRSSTQTRCGGERKERGGSPRIPTQADTTGTTSTARHVCLGEEKNSLIQPQGCWT